LFHPLLFPTYGTALIIAANPHLFAVYKLKGQLLWLIIVFIMTFIFPVVWLVMMRRLDLISSFKLENPKERIIPYIAVATFYMWTYRQFKPAVNFTPYANSIISHMMLGASIAIFIGFFVNIFRKISLHAIGAGAFMGLVLPLMRISDYDLKLFFIFVLISGGLVGTARLILDAHEPNEIWMGYAAGFIGMFASFTVLPTLFG
jgi:hypothetical protein